jgi:hypothetical protein
MSGSQSLNRPNYFNGKLLTPEDFKLEQDYFREKHKRHNRSLHGFGIVSGLKVSVSSGQIVIEPGLALDCEGNEIVVDAKQSIVPPALGDSLTAYLNIRYCEVEADLTPGLKGEQPSRTTESFQLGIAAENSSRSHRHLRARWLACGQPHALTIAKLRFAAHGWRVDRGYRPPAVK